MPTLSSSVLPPPKSWDEFEDITHSALKIKWNSPSLTRHGRLGQSQSGVDIYGPNELGALAGVQCKLSASEISAGPTALVELADTFQPALHEFFFATASPTDATLQREIRLLSVSRVAAGRFPVGILFWGDLVQELIKDKPELCKHYPQFCGEVSATIDDNVRLLALVTLAYYGLSLNYYIELIFGEFGRMAQEDPRQFSVVTRTVSACTKATVGPSDGELIRRHLAVLDSRVFEAYETDEDTYDPWRSPQDLAAEIEAYVRNVEYTLDGRGLWAFRVGALLARWSRIALRDGAFPEELRKKLEAGLRALFQAEDIPAEIAAEIASYDPSRIGSSTVPGEIHTLVREHLRFETGVPETRETDA